ncbi:MBL fold metallo-hydrolase [Oscillatoria salina]|uniref:MBL fold metallo-hydrolase n=1 Tax=Oscillatoria salina TaxID=331517 RepID=UPI0013BDCAF2|nr:MBL fold metallo-hydrolase [Oscillatoria salina]MBZ8182491.1 MBL fold metallo-hydrolase [Oscillatoria salina IIICB1]NET86987.1 MBL fold metallo-hydrolase [Kamptonema sp. SIO1D9]
MKIVKLFIVPLLLAVFTSFIIISCSPSEETTTSTTGEPTTTESASVNESALEVNVFEASEKGVLVLSSLIEGENEAILVDSQLLLSEAERLADQIETSGKELKAIWITHAHPDHYFGVEKVLEKFPETPVYSTPEIVGEIEQRNPQFVQGLKQNYGDDVTGNPIVPEAYNEDYIDLDGERLEIIKFNRGDTPNTTGIKVPDGTVIAADVLYWGVHPFLVEAATKEARSAWLTTIDNLEAMNPTQVIPGHKAPEFNLSNSLESIDSMRKYLNDFGTIVQTKTSADEALAAVEEAYPDYKLPGFFLRLSTQAAYQNQS